jgi:hypothetical protein
MVFLASKLISYWSDYNILAIKSTTNQSIVRRSNERDWVSQKMFEFTSVSFDCMGGTLGPVAFSL